MQDSLMFQKSMPAPCWGLQSKKGKKTSWGRHQTGLIEIYVIQLQKIQAIKCMFQNMMSENVSTASRGLKNPLKFVVGRVSLRAQIWIRNFRIGKQACYLLGFHVWWYFHKKFCRSASVLVKRGANKLCLQSMI
jgi:hypothetical protein